MERNINFDCSLGRRRVFQLGALGGIAALGATALAAGPTWASGQTAPVVTDLGPGVVQFGSKSAVQVGDTLYIGSRNIEPTYVAAFHIPTRKIVATTAIPNGRSIQGIEAGADGRYLYFAIENPGGVENTVFRWDLSDTSKPAEPLGRAADVTIWNMSVTPDGYAYFGGKEAPPQLWQYNPNDGVISAVGSPEPSATGVRTVLATQKTVYVGSGTVLSGSAQTSNAVLAAYDREAGTMTQILPPELAQDETVRSLALAGDKLVVGTYGGSVPTKIAVLEVANPSSYRVVEITGVTTKALLVHDGKLYFSAGANNLQILDLDTMELAPLEVDGLDFGEVWGMGWDGDQLHVVSAYGFVAHIDVDARTATLTGLIDAGAPAEPQLAMSVTAGGGYAYVAANGALARHSFAHGEVVNLIAPGETKHGVVAGGVLYMGQYSGLGLYGYNPETDELPSQLAALPAVQNRPVFAGWDAVNARALITTQSDSAGGGCVGVYDPATGHIDVHVNPLDDFQLIRWAACKDGVVYLGGDNAYDQGPRGEIAAFNPLTGEVLWRVDPKMAGGVSSLAILGNHLYASLNLGGFAVVDIPSRSIIHKANIKALGNNRSSLVVTGGRVHGLSDKNLYRFDPFTFAPTVVVPGLNSAFYGGHSKMDVDEQGDIYTLRGRNLVRIEVPAYPQAAVEVSTRSIGRNTMLAVRATNTESVPVDITLSTPYGEKRFTGILTGANAYHPFTIRAQDIPAGQVTVSTTVDVGGSPVSNTKTVAYSAN